MMWIPLVEYKRKGISEVVIHGAITWVSGDKLIYQAGGNIELFARSLAKPFQLSVFTQELSTTLTVQEKAIALSSHNGEEKQVHLAKHILSSSKRHYLKTPASLPLKPSSESKQEKNSWIHCCSGKHAAIIKGCLTKGWSVHNYLLIEHPFHQSFLEEIKNILGSQWQPRITTQDGCHMPTVTFTLSQLATLFSYLVRNKKKNWIWEAMTTHPELVGGVGRLDSLILKNCKGLVLAKEGADGLLGLSITHPHYPNGLGIVLKIAHGWDSVSMHHIAYTILGALDFKIHNVTACNKQEATVKQDVLPPSLRTCI